MTAAWRVEFTPAQELVWLETFDGCDASPSRDALRLLKDAADIIPSHAEFKRAYNDERHRVAVQHQERMLSAPAPASCSCDGGWVYDAPEAAGYRGAVRRCPRCSAPPTSASEHPKTCTCMDCSYGVEGAASIRAGAPQSFIDAVNRKGVVPMVVDGVRRPVHPAWKTIGGNPDALADRYPDVPPEPADTPGPGF